MANATVSRTEPLSAARVSSDGGRVWIEDVPSLFWGAHRECTFMGAAEAALSVTHHPCSYNRLMGLSGMAFRMRWYVGRDGKGSCPSSPVGEFAEETAAMERATGWRLEQHWHMDAPVDMDAYAPQIRESIDAGLPVIAYASHLNVAVIYGYEDDGHTLLMRDYLASGALNRVAATELGPMLMFPGSWKEPPPEKDNLIQALGIAATNWRRPPMPGPNGEYHFGVSAYEQWAAAIEHCDRLTPEERDHLFFVNWWVFDNLEDSRRAAADFLQENAALLDDEPRELLERAASAYRTLHERLCAVFETRDAFLGPWTGRSVEDWAEAMRRREVEIIREAGAADLHAVREIARTLLAELELDDGE